VDLDFGAVERDAKPLRAKGIAELEMVVAQAQHTLTGREKLGQAAPVGCPPDSGLGAPQSVEPEHRQTT
jgi:hypothetical protein